MSARPFSPDEAKEAKKTTIPDAVVHAVNELLAENYSNYIRIRQPDVIKRVAELDPSLTSKVLFDNKFLDFESLFEGFGWKVEYDKPGYDESYDAFWIFRPKGSR